MTNRQMYIVIVAVLIVGGASYFGYMHYQKNQTRVASIEKYLDDICFAASSDRNDPATDVYNEDSKLKECQYNIHAKAVSFAQKSNYKLIEALVATCVSEPGGINTTDRLQMRVAALDPSGTKPIQSDEDFCRGKVRKTFPELGE